ncbi:hypothetical protein DFH09DRAFT_1090739 [Mycena vulgaris]|nr:hypothetical protein DFH09DRAFT_1090739 [Mycena vulgaris]
MDDGAESCSRTGRTSRSGSESETCIVSDEMRRGIWRRGIGSREPSSTYLAFLPPPSSSIPTTQILFLHVNIPSPPMSNHEVLLWSYESTCLLYGGMGQRTGSQRLYRGLHRTYTKMQTPPTSPQRHQYRARQILRDINVSQDNSPCRRRVPASFDENRPPSPPRSSTPTPGSRANARSSAQAERRERERRDRAEDPPHIRKRKRPPRPELDGPPNARQLAQRKRRERERMEEENRIRTRVPILPLARFSNTQSTFTCPKGVIQWPFHTSRNTAAQWSET